MAEFIEATSNRALRKFECSFCGDRQSADEITRIPCSQLDISLLEQAVVSLREICSQPAIEAFDKSSLVDGCYIVCPACRRDITYSSFTKLPLRNYANGLWTGSCPKELQDLTFLEQQCIARARTTRCMFKLEMGPTGQYASRGNVCIFVQDPGPLLSILPPPLTELFGETCVILVGSVDTPVTASMLENTPLLVRRKHIIDTLMWLKENNPL
ncbi:hypothetical protein C8R45DRAFT_814640 [Mycena sanguinolenta]|nr:hypothetical protein C8R45DRAFT_814640 [Mycena sanguinolenta]